MSESIVIFSEQEFATYDEAHKLYNAYARDNGFGVRKKE